MVSGGYTTRGVGPPKAKSVEQLINIIALSSNAPLQGQNCSFVRVEAASQSQSQWVAVGLFASSIGGPGQCPGAHLAGSCLSTSPADFAQVPERPPSECEEFGSLFVRRYFQKFQTV